MLPDLTAEALSETPQIVVVLSANVHSVRSILASRLLAARDDAVAIGMRFPKALADGCREQRGVQIQPALRDRIKWRISFG